MVRPAKITINTQAEGWDSALKDNIDTILDAPFPIFRDINLAAIQINYPANEFEQCLTLAEDSGYIYLSDGTNWIRLTQGQNHLNVTTVTTNYTVDVLDDVIKADATSGNVTVTLLSAVGQEGKVYHIKKVDGSINTVTIDADGTETIDAVLSKILTSAWDSLSVVSDGGNWLIIGQI